MDANIRQLEFYGFNETVLSPFAALFTAVLAILVLRLKKEKAVAALIAAALFITHLQRVIVMGLDFSLMRLVVCAAILRIVLRHESLIRWNRLDAIMVFYILSAVLTQTLLWASLSTLINRLGFALDALGAYFACRILLADVDGVRRSTRIIAAMSMIVAAVMILEWITGRNPFSFMGGVPELTYSREGRLRAQAAFAHAILAGSYGAALLPLMVGLWMLNDGARALAFWGIVSAAVITAASSSSGPILAFLAGIAGLLAWNIRRHMRVMLLSGLLLLIGLDLVMRAPLWSLIGRATIVAGSTGYHRYMLVDQAIRRFPEWALLGTRTTAHWAWGLQDVTNMYIGVGASGGVLPLAFFIASIVLSFRAVGRSGQALEGRPELQRFVWALGATLFAHTVSFLGVTYFDHTVFFWYMTLAMVSIVASEHGGFPAAARGRWQVYAREEPVR